MGIRKCFTKLSDLAHLVLGMLAGILLRFPMCVLISFLIVVTFLIYQMVEPEEPAEGCCDLVEFMYGFVLGFTMGLLSNSL